MHFSLIKWIDLSKASDIPEAFHPAKITFFPSNEDNWLNPSITHFEWSGLIVVSLNFMLISSRDFQLHLTLSSRFLRTTYWIYPPWYLLPTYWLVNQGLGNRQSCYLGHIRKLRCFLSTKMSPPQSSNLKKRLILKAQVDQNFQFFSFQLRRMEWQFLLSVWKLPECGCDASCLRSN